MKGLFGKAIIATTLLVGLATGSAFAAKGDIIGGNGGTTVGGSVTTLGTIPNASVNVNGTGTGIKNVNGQMTHTAYKENTNSCASCHMTHTANSKSLLFGTGVEDTCTSCHDGTLGFYDVVAGKVFPAGAAYVTREAYVTSTDTIGSNAGRFAFESGATGSTNAAALSARSAKNPSMHNTGSSNLKLAAAPGGNRTGLMVTTETKWTSTTFTCASCHAPHGSYSDRLLHYNPNGFGAVDITKGGYGLANREYKTVADVQALAVTATDYVVVYGTRQEHADFSTTNDTVDVAYFGNLTTNPTHYQDYDVNKVVMLYKKIGTTWTIDTTPWLDDTKLNATSGIPFTGTLANNIKPSSFTASKGFISHTQIKAPDGVVTASVVRPAIVSLDLVEVGTTLTNGVSLPLYVTNNAAVIGGKPDANGDIVGKYGITTKLDFGDTVVVNGGKQMSTFCAACHTDYLASSKGSVAGTTTWLTGSAAAGGVYDASKFRHTTNNDTYSCVKCHYAHGTDQDLQRDATGEMSATADVNPSSALKRYVNMAVCWGCHTSSKSTSLINNKSYQFDNSYDKPKGLHDTDTWSEGMKWGVQN